MFKILMKLKESIFAVIAIVILLCVQAWADLELPNYTSKIVNIGIQAGGIENVAPEIISKNSMDNMLLFTKDDEQILNYYELNTSDLSKSSTKKIEKYFGKDNSVEKDSIYVLKDLTKEDKNSLDGLIQKPLLASYSITKEEMQNQIKNEIMEKLQGNEKQILGNMTLLEILNNMPQEQLDVIVEKINTQINEKMGTMISQAAQVATKEEYKALGINTDNIQNNYIFIAGLQMLGIAGISMISAIVIMLLSSRVAARLGKTLREKVFKNVLNFTTKEFTEFSTASLITRSTNDIQQIQSLISILFRVVVYAPIIGIGGFIRVLTKSDTSMAWIIGAAILAILAIVLVLFIIAMPKFKKLQDLIDKLNLVSREILTGLPVIRAFHTERREEDRFDTANTELMNANIFVNRAMSIMMPALTLVMNGVTLLIIWIGGENIDSGIMQVGDMMAFIQYTMQIVISFLMISMISIMLPRAAVSARRINEVIETEPSIKDIDNPKNFDKNKTGVVEFKNVSFRYPDADQELLTDISFTAEPGKTTAIIGSTGSGKSTIVNLIPRFYDVTGGELLVDGVNIKQVSRKRIKRKDRVCSSKRSFIFRNNRIKYKIF